MPKDRLQEKFNILNELIRTVAKNLEPMDTLKALQYKQLRDRLRGKYPKCFISVKRLGGQDPDFFPVCNTAGMIDVRAIELSIRSLSKLMDSKSGEYDINELSSLLAKLQKMRETYDKDVPKPPEMAGRKSMVTRMLNNVKSHLNTVRR